MRAKGRPPTQVRRALRACVVVCALCVGACALDGPVSALGDVAGAASWAQQAARTQGAQQAAQAEGGESLPQWFDEELFSLDGCDAVRVAADGAVVGFETDVEAVQALDGIAARLADKGWTRVDSGVEGNAAFVKGGGTCRWAWVSCIGVGGATSVVVQCAADGG